MPIPARAQLDPLIEGAKQCTRHLSHYEREYGIPTHLLSAIASTETGRYHDGLKIKVPWPWTINAEGKGYFFDTKEEAVAAVKRLRARGVQSVDVGCMQVNLYHHPQAFASLEQAFEPQANIAYAASFLRSLYEDGHSWKKAAADYHSKTPALGSEYVGLVYNSWYQIVDKLRAAKLQVPGTEMAAMSAMQTADMPYGARSMASAAASGVHIVRLPEQEGKRLPTYRPPHMNSIHVASHKEDDARARRENGIIIIHPEIKVADNQDVKPLKVSVPSGDATRQLTVAETQPDMLMQGASEAPDTKVIRVNAPQAAIHKTEPNFIFSD